MKSMMPPYQTAILGAATAVALLCSVAGNTAAAAEKTWDGEGADDFWQTAANWDPTAGGTAPVANDFLFFDGITRLTTTNDFAAGTVFRNINFTAGAGAFTLNGNSLILTNGAEGLNGTAPGGSISNASPNAQTFSLPLTLSAGRHNIQTDPGAGQLSFNGAVTRNTGAVVMFTPNGTTINTTGSGLANINGILGGWAIVGNDWAALDASSNVVAYTAYTDVTGAPVIANDPASNVRFSGDTGNATATNVTINSLLCNLTSARSIAINGQLRLGSRGGIWRTAAGSATPTITGGTLTADGGGEITILAQPGTASGSVVIQSKITNDGPNVVSVNVFGYITLNSNYHSGGTYINQGRVTYNSVGAYGTGPVIVFPGAETFQNGANCTNDLFLSGTGPAETSGGSTGPGALRLSARTQLGKVTLRASTRITTSSTSASTILSGQITGEGPLEVATFATDNSLMLFSNTGTANDWTGGLTLSSLVPSRRVTLRLGANNQIPDGAGKGNLTINATNTATPATLDLNGFSETVNGLSSAANTGNRVINSSLTTPSTLTVGGNDTTATFGGDIGVGGTNNIALVKIGTGTQTLTGANTYSNSTTVNAGSLVFGASGSFPAGTAAVTVNSNATLDVSAACPVTLAAAAPLTTSNGTTVVALQPVGNAVTTTTLNALGSTNFVTISAIPSISTYPAQFVAIKYTTLNGTLNFGLGGALPVSPGTPFAGYISNNTANGSVDLVVTAGPSSFKWVGYSSGTTNLSWDTVTTNWVTFAGAPALFANGSFVQFDDSASNGLVNLDIVASPAGVTVTNSALAYTIGGANYISGGGNLTKQGAGTLILDQSGVNDFTGGVTISGGTLQIGNNDAAGNLPATGNVVDNGALVFTRNDGVTVPNVISGTGTLTQNGSGTLLLSVANTFTGAVSVLQGTLQTGNNAALGTTNGGTTVASGATLDVTANAINLGQEPITISGTGVGGGGALVNNSGSLTFVGPNAARVTMAGDATVGGSGRFDLRSATTSNPLLGSLSTAGLPRKLTKVGGGTFGLIGITVDPALGDIEVQQGIFSLEAAMTGLGNVASNLSVWPGGTLQMFAITNLLNKVITLGGDGATTTVSATSGTGNTIIGPMSITNDCIFNVGTAFALNLNNVITGPGKITKIGAGLLTLSGTSPDYAGGLQLNNGNVTLSGTMSNSVGVTVSAGKFTLNGTLLGAGLTSGAGTTLAGSGTAVGPADVSGIVFPGETNVIGTLTAGGLVLQTGATLFYDLTATNAVGGSFNDLITVNGDLAVNGNAVTINPIGLLKTGVGNPYRLFNYTGNLIWNADLTVTGPYNYIFTVNTNTVGQVNVVVSGGPPIWNGGSVADSNWSSSNNWGGVTILSGDTLYFAGTNRLDNTNDTAAGNTYLDLAFNTDAGAFTLNGNDITLGGNIINNSTNAQTVNLGLSSGVNRTFNGAAGTLIIGGGVTNTATTLTTLTLAGTGILTNQLYNADVLGTNVLSIGSNANWTLMDNPSSIALTNPVQLDVLAGTFNFGTGSSAPNLASTTLRNSRIGVTAGAPAIFNMAGGTLTIEARLNTGAAAGAIATLNQSGGTINVGLFQGSDSSANAMTTMNVTGGTFNSTDTIVLNNFFLASRGTGVVTVAGSGAINCATLDMSRNAAGNTLGSVGVVHLNGGILTASRIGAATSAAQAGGTPTATFNFNGGILKAGASSASFYQGNAASPAIPIVSIVKSGGAIIDTTNFNISVLEPLQHDAGLGSTPDGGLIKHGTGALTLTAASTYTGNTVVSNGTLVVNGLLGVTATVVASNATLAGTGSLGSNVTVNVGGTVSPGDAAVLGVLTVVSNVTLSGTAAMDLNKSTATNDVLKGATITYGGTLSLTNLAGTLAATDTFKLFSAPVYAGSFAALDPAIPGTGLAWDTNTLTTDGILRLVATVNTTPTNIVSSVSGGNLTMTWPSDHIGWTLQAQTNTRAVGLNTNWFNVAGSAATNQVTVPVDAANPTVFYRLTYP